MLYYLKYSMATKLHHLNILSEKHHWLHGYILEELNAQQLCPYYKGVGTIRVIQHYLTPETLENSTNKHLMLPSDTKTAKAILLEGCESTGGDT